jgi:internalin A
MISRLTVRLHRFVCNPEKAWVTGVLFERAQTSVLVELLPGGNEIELRARGPERKELLSVVAADLDALNDSFQGLKDKVAKLIPCTCPVCAQAAVPKFFAQKELIERKEHGKSTVECPAPPYHTANVLELLDGVRLQTPPAWAKDEPQSPQTIRLFLASSAELRADRDEFDRYFRERNDELINRGLYLRIIRWENFLDAMSGTRLQDEYNKAIRECDIFVCLFFTKTGKFTDEEFEVAHRQFQESGKPRIWTYFKNADIKTGSAPREDLKSLWAFQDKLKDKGHYHTEYTDIEHLKRQFRDQLDKLLSGSNAEVSAGS